MLQQYRKYNRGEFITVGVDPSAGANDFTAAQFLSKTNLDVPGVIYVKQSITSVTPTIHIELERIFDETGIQPVVAYERQNGGVFELERLATLNRNGKYKIFTMPSYGAINNPESSKIGWDTNTATRPKMLQDLKEAIDKQLIKLYHKPTVKELFTFIISRSGKPQAEEGAHDDLCFVAGTKILTNNGQVPIENIRVGDLVMTRNGYRPVIATNSRYAKVVTNLGLTGTPDHPIITKKGTVSLATVKASDIIYMWNEKQSSIEEKSITATQIQREDSLGSIIGDTISGKNLHLHSTGKFGLTILAQSLRDMLFTIKMVILLITHQTILHLRKRVSTSPNTFLNQIGINSLCLTVIGKPSDWLDSYESGGKTTPKKQAGCIAKMANDKLVELFKPSKSGKKKTQTNTKLFFVETDSKTLKELKRRLQNGEPPTQKSGKNKLDEQLVLVFMEKGKKPFVRNVVKSLFTPVLWVLSFVHNFVGRVIAGKQRVYNLQVAETPEYFANNILVHNCMALAIAWQLYQVESPVVQISNYQLPQFQEEVDSDLGM